MPLLASASNSKIIYEVALYHLRSYLFSLTCKWTKYAIP